MELSYLMMADRKSAETRALTRLHDSFILCNTCDVEKARALIAEAICSYRLELSPTQAERPIIAHIGFGEEMRLLTVSYGRPARTIKEVAEEYILISTMTKGAARVEAGQQRSSCTSGSTLVCDLEVETETILCESSRRSIIRIGTENLKQFCQSLFGICNARRRMSFKLEATVAAANPLWRALFFSYTQALDPGTPESARRQLIRRVEEMIMINLLTAHDWVGREELMTVSTYLAPAALRRAIDYIEHHATSALTLSDIAQAASCSIRSLQRAFANALNQTPMQYVKQVRLRFARDALASASVAGTVTSIASQYGFNHLGQFAIDYRKAFGERPSETLRRRM